MQQTATIITIGDELLIGQVIDTNSAWMAQQLNDLGIEVRRRIAIADDKAAIVAALNEELPRCDFLLLTGGLGPTADDITKPVLAEYFGGKLVIDPVVLEHVQSFFKKRNRPMLERNTQQAAVPDCATVLFNKLGTAPGMWFERDGKVVISLPGVPFEMMYLMEQQVLPRLKPRMLGGVMVHQSIITAGEGESYLAEKIVDLEAELPKHIKLAYLPAAGMVRLRLSGKGDDELRLLEEMTAHRDRIVERLRYCVLSQEDLPLEQLVGQSYIDRGKTIGLVESCTGGGIANRFTQMSGSSRFFNGSLVCYQTELKKSMLGVPEELISTHTVYSEPVALAMAKSAARLMASDVGFGITGLLEKEDMDGIPGGTVCMAAVDGDREQCYTVHCWSDRIRNKEIAITHALLFLWKFINHR
ncbi:MAG: CinA family nicotinamide mononucleotide deamidase-related protein [Bacteroidetes bacterium]|nr:CinA family nicotinamide mononucleotide deamidase-related protein [Bacteroidota bacterium]